MATPVSKIWMAGEAGSPLASVTERPVDIYQIRRAHQVNPALWEDPDFPATQESIGWGPIGDFAVGQQSSGTKYWWMRPHELCSSAKSFGPYFAIAQETDTSAEGQGPAISAADLRQGGLGDCWFIAALQALTVNPEQLGVVVPRDNMEGFEEDKYCGAFHFRFFSPFHNKWVDVVVDDRLPVMQGGPEWVWMPAFLNSSVWWGRGKYAEFWAPLVEKAYAKFIGNFSKIDGGLTGQGLVNFTAGFADYIPFNDPKSTHRLTADKGALLGDQIWRRVLGFKGLGNFLGFGTDSALAAYQKSACRLEGYSTYIFDSAKGFGEVAVGLKYDEASRNVVPDGSRKGLGLVGPHAYSARHATPHAREVKSKDGLLTYRLLQFRNPHATHEWLGAFGDADDAGWALLEEDLREKDEVGTRQLDNGVFWIDLESVLKYFNAMESCAFGFLPGTHAAHVKGVWSAALTNRPLKLHPADFSLFTSYKFEARCALPNLNRPAEFAGKAMVAFSVVLGAFNSKTSAPFTYLLFKTNEEEISGGLAAVLWRQANEYAWAFGREASFWGFLDEGMYLLVPALISDPGNSGQNVLPQELAGKDVEFAVRLFTENDAKLQAIAGTPL